MKIPDFTISIPELKSIIYSNLSFELDNDTLEIIFYALGLQLIDDTKVDFLLFVKIYYLIYQKINGELEQENISQQMFDDNVENKRYNEQDKKEGEEEGEIQEGNVEVNEENENEGQEELYEANENIEISDTG